MCHERTRISAKPLKREVLPARVKIRVASDLRRVTFSRARFAVCLLELFSGVRAA